LEKVVLAYSGGLDTSVCIHWLRNKKGMQVYTFSADLGQLESAEELARRAFDVGAHSVFIKDLRARLAEEFILPAIYANAAVRDGRCLSVALSRPLITEELIMVAQEENARYLAHGGSAKSNDQIRFQLTVAALAPEMDILAPMREPELASSGAVAAYAGRHGLAIPTEGRSIYGEDENIWGRVVSGTALERLAAPAAEDLFRMTVSPKDAPDEPEDVRITFDGGRPVALDGEEEDLVAVIERIGERAARHGVGRFDSLQTKIIGIKTRMVSEAPAATAVTIAHRALEGAVLPHNLLQVKHLLEDSYADIVYNGLWFSRVRRSLDAFFAETQHPVTGTVTLRFFKGVCRPVSVESEFSLYDRLLATHGPDDAFDAEAAAGFADVFVLEHRLEALQHRRLRERREPPAP